jgi:molybdopterin molybdotransferase
MITVEEARKRINETIRILPVKEVPLQQAFRHFTATPVISPHDHPLFDNSAVDGYALKFADAGRSLKVVGSIAAGEVFPSTIGPGECVRIFTGAMMPRPVDTVVMQEHVSRTDDLITLLDDRLQRGSNVRKKGEQIQAGEQILPPGEQLSSAAIGLLASVGIRTVKVHEWPYVTVIVTGNEFTEKGNEPGRIFSSNDLMLLAALEAEGVRSQLLYAGDDKEQLRSALREAMSRSDLIITTGGVSVGDHDLVAPVLQELGTEIIFHKVSQKPGKPMLFGRNGNAVIFGLPGNPRAVMILFWEYIFPAIRKMMGVARSDLRSSTLPIDVDVQLKGERSEFRAAQRIGDRVSLLPDEGSHMLSTLVSADSLVYFPVGVNEVKKGDLVEVHHLPDK